MSWKEFRNCPSLPSTCAKTCSHRTKVRKRRALPLAQQSSTSMPLTSPSKQGRKALLPSSARRLAGGLRCVPRSPRGKPDKATRQRQAKPQPNSPQAPLHQAPPQTAADPRERARRPAGPQHPREHRARLVRDSYQRAEGYQSERQGIPLSRPRQSRRLPRGHKKPRVPSAAGSMLSGIYYIHEGGAQSKEPPPNT